MKTLSTLTYSLVSVTSLAVLGLVVSLVSGPQTGTTVIYHPDGGVAIVMSRDSAGELHGQYRQYLVGGKLKSILEYEHGAVVRFAHYYPSGRLQSRSIEGAGYSLRAEDFPDVSTAAE